MKLRVKFRAEDQHRTYCRYFRTILLFWWSIFDGSNIHRTAIYKKALMITYPIPSNLCKKKLSAMLSALQFSIFQKQPLEMFC